MVITLAGAVLLLQGSRGEGIKRTRYRLEIRTRLDWLVIAGSVVSAAACVVARNADQRLFLYEPYPSVGMPATSHWLLVGLFGLFAPAIVAPVSEGEHD
jgi:hypothetical protein